MSGRKVPEALAEKLSGAAAALTAPFEEIRMEDIAKASGVPRATLYYYFPSKDEVLGFLLRSMLEDLRISVATAVEQGGDVKTRLVRVVRAQLASLAANPSTSQLLIMNLGKAGQLETIASGVDAGFQGPVRRILADGVRDGVLVEIDVNVVAAAFYGAVTIAGLQALVLEGAIDVDRLADTLFPVFWAGIAKPGAAGRSTGAR